MATGVDSSNPSSYELEVLTIVNNEGDGFDIRDLLVECNIYEAIDQNFLMGELIIGDSINLLENAKLFGQESLRIRFKQPSGVDDETEEEDLIDQIFRIYKISNVKRIDESSQIYQLSFCAPQFLQSRRTRVSQALRGSMTDIAALLGEDHLGIANEVKDKKLEAFFEVREKSQGDNYHVVIPNWSVNYTMNWLCAQAQGLDSSSGLQDSFFFYQTANGGFRIQSLDSMMKVDYAGGRPFTYSQAAAAENTKNIPTDASTDVIGSGRRILGYEIGSQADVFQGIVNGLFGSKQITIDNTYKFYIEKTYSFLEKFFGGAGQALDPHPFVRTQPEITHIGSAATDGDVSIIGTEEGKGIGDYPDAYTILTSDSSFINDETDKIVQANHFVHMGAKQFRAAASQLLEYYSINCVLSARTDISVGQVINLDIPAARAGEDEVKPKFYNGKHLITEVMWNITPNECNLNIKCIKDSVLSNIETTGIEYGESL
jgi:hypothetical protein|tara:strand:- start:941 stop:2401 length:1461 start_codon:yes stop_codon:yes gene_type:complete